MMKCFLTVLCFVWIGIATVSAATLAGSNQRFASGDFSGAAVDYEKLLADHGPDAAVFYNLGNARQQLKQYGPAILAYERAKLLTPRDPDLLANLARARKAATAFGESGMNPRLEAVVTRLSRNEWSSLVAGGALFLGALAAVCGAIGLPRRGLRQLALGTSILATLLVIAGAGALYLRRAESALGIVLAENATVRLSPFENAESIGTPGPGKVVHLGEKNGGFHYISVPGANLQGWLADKDVAAITPAPAKN